VGAAAGSWSLSAFELWPDSSFILFEPLEERNAELKALDSRFANFHFIPAAAGKEKGQVSFYVSGDLDGSGVATGVSNDPNIRTVNVVSIDEEVMKLELKGPYLVKLDTHGFEVPIIEGAQKILPHVSVFIIECYGFQIAEKSLLFWEMCKYMDHLGFRLFDIVDVMNRAKDGAFWQCDAFFLRKDNKIFEYPQYS
jgi:FkbM family methyltransferase